MYIWRKLEFRGRDPQDNPCVDFGFIALDGDHFVLTSHLIRDPLWVNSAEAVLAEFQRVYQARGFTHLRYKILWAEGQPVDTAFEEGWVSL
jgi:hypothetical protein